MAHLHNNMPIWAAYLPKLLLQLGLLLVFLSYFGLPTLNNYLEGEVILTVRGGADDKDDYDDNNAVRC